VRTARLARALLLCAAVCALASACRGPGEPPTHPDSGTYRDIIRREADSTHTALATTSLLVRTAQAQGLPGTYARVTLRSAAGDLDHVVTDLGQITPPRAQTVPQDRLATIARRDARLLVRLRRDWDDRALRIVVLHTVTRHADEIDRRLDDELQG
jgi:hypothetical protein